MKADQLNLSSGQLLVTARQAKQLTRKTAALELKMDDHTLRSVENAPGSAKTNTLLKVLAFYGLTLKDLL